MLEATTPPTVKASAVKATVLIVEPEIVLDPGDRGLEDQFLFGARDLLFVERGDRGLRGTRDEAEGEQREDGGGLHRCVSFMPGPARAGWSEEKRIPGAV